MFPWGNSVDIPSQQDWPHLRIKETGSFGAQGWPDGPKTAFDSHPLTPSPEGISPAEFSKYLICFSLKRLILFSFEAYLYLDRAYSAVEFELLKQKLCLVYEPFVHVIRYLLK